MDAFHPAEIPPEYYAPQAYMDRFKVSYEEAVGMVAAQVNQQYFVNSTYQVNLGGPHRAEGDAWPVMWHLSVKRRDKEVIHDWRDLQTIKNMIIGPENEAFEIYPAESRLVDMANQYHSWVFKDPSVRLPVPYYLETLMAKTGPKRKPLAQRLWAKVDMSSGPDVCWPWTGGTNGEYGIISRGGDSTGVSPLYAHRVAYCLANGLDYSDLASSDEVMHSCDKPLCCNPQHLSMGTSAANKQDAISKGRMFWQKAQRNAKGQFESGDADSEGD
jgi:hypothetical protein